ncbi:MAG: thioredoxin family protein [Nitrospirae bacterium]|nr:thioredoxin family protein [Nitrospirota bacterium]
MKRFFLLTLIFTAFMLQSCADASELDLLLNKAQKEGRIVMLELGSVGCIPCDAMKPVMEKLAKNHKGRLDVIFVDVKKDKTTAKRFGVYMIPVQVFLDKKGKEFHRHVGYYPYQEIVPVLKKSGI